MKRLKSLLSLTLLSALIFSGCTGNSATPTPPSQATPVVGDDGIISYKNLCEFHYYSLSHASPGSDIDYPFNAYARQNKYVWYSPIELTVTAAKKLFEGDIDEENVTRAADWLAALYTTSLYSDAEQMKKNLEYRYENLSDSLTEYVKQNEAELIKRFMQKNVVQELGFNAGQYRFMFYEHLIKLKDSDGKQYVGTELSCKIILKGKDYKSLYTDYIASAGYCLQDFQYQNSETASAHIFPAFVIVFDENGKLTAWGESAGRLASCPPTRYLVAGKSGVNCGEEILPTPLTVDSSFKNTDCIYLTDAGRNAQKTAISCYRELRGLSGSADDNYFDTFLNYCSDELKSALQKSGILKEMIADARKYKIKIALDPKSTSAAEKEENYLYVYRNTDYGDVYVYDRNCFIKTGSDEFNKKYGLPEDKWLTNFKFYVAGDSGKLVGFEISSKIGDEENSYYDLDQVWQGNWDNG